MTKVRTTREKWTFTTPEPILDAAEAICVELTARYCDKAFRRRNRTRRIRRIPAELLSVSHNTGKSYEDLMQMLENEGIESSVYYCSLCKEHLPDREEDLCEHVWWCDTDSTLRGPGSTEDYGPEPCGEQDCFYCQRELDRIL